MTRLSRTSDVCRYVDLAAEHEISVRQGRISLASPIDLAELGVAIFDGLDGEERQECIDTEIGIAISRQQGRIENEPTSLHELIDEEDASFVRDYIAARVKTITGRPTEARTARTNDDRVPMYYAGKWRDDATYRRGDTVTRTGLMWHCNREGTTDVPGTNDAWTMTHKSHGKNDGPGAAA